MQQPLSSEVGGDLDGQLVILAPLASFTTPYRLCHIFSLSFTMESIKNSLVGVVNTKVPTN